MSSDVVLTAALRNNLLSLQSTQRAIDTTQFRLATGLKVNSALDNPQNFFAAQALNNRAGDLQRLLDGIGQSIRTIESADAGVTAITKLIEQAESVAQSARDQLNAAEGTSVAESMSALNLAEIDNLGDLATGSFTLTFTVGNGASNTATVMATTNQSIGALVANIDNIDNVNASLTSDGQLRITTTNGDALRIQASAAAILNDPDNLGLVDADAAGATAVFAAGNSLRATLNVAGQAADRTAMFSELDGFGTALAGTFTIMVATNATTSITLSANNTASATISSFVDQINLQFSSQGVGVSASYDDATGELVIEFDAEDLEYDGQITVTGFTGSDFGFGVTTNTMAATGTNVIDGGGTTVFNVGGGAIDDTLSNLEGDFNEIRAQIDNLVEDANYRGTNLLAEEDLLTVFNEFRTNTLTTTGVDFTSVGLGIGAADFATDANVAENLSQIRAALESVRNFGTTLANDLAIIQTRRDFTENTINTLQAGADDLTVADQNEEGANLLALQTRQALGVTSLSLASQSQQSVLRLF